MSDAEEVAAEVVEEEKRDSGKPVHRDIRRYYCEFCGICRSKKALIASHVLSEHKDEIGSSQTDTEKKTSHLPCYTCEECGSTFKKPAYLKQHMQSHYPERPFCCSIDDCHATYRRKDHLNRHSLSHQGKLFTCPIADCKRQFTIQANMKRHVVELHDEASPPSPACKLYTCSEVGCGKSFKYPSKLSKHEKTHVKLDHVEVKCCETGCLKYFSNKECLRAHIKSCHQYTKCPDCGTQQLKKNFRRHQRIHEEETGTIEIPCSFDGCHHSFSNRSNLNVHIKAVHLEEKPYVCRMSGCGKRYPFKQVRDHHEKSGIHIYVPGNFMESDMLFRSRSKGGRKRKCESVDMLLRKRVASLDQDFVMDNATEYLQWLLGEETQQ